MRKDETFQMLRSVPLFEGLSQRELRSIHRTGKEMEFPAGTTIVQEELTGIDFYLILKGEARVTIGGRTRRTLRPGDYFGEISVIDGGRRSASVTALSRVWALRLDRSAFRRLLKENPSITYKILLEMCRRVREAQPSPTH